MKIVAKPSRRIIGLMSGTSLDAIDAAMVRITGHGTEASIKLEHFNAYPFPPKIRAAAPINAAPCARLARFET